jgi:hypothetical protein
MGVRRLFSVAVVVWCVLVGVGALTPVPLLSAQEATLGVSSAKLAKISWLIVTFGELERSQGVSRYHMALWLMNFVRSSLLYSHTSVPYASPR